MSKSTTPNREFEYHGHVMNGFAMLAVNLLLIPGLFVASLLCLQDSAAGIVIDALLGIAFIFCTCGYIVQEPNEARVLIFFGQYRGTCKRVGYMWINPFMSRRKMSLRICNMDIDPIKVNDRIGNPVMIGMVLVWKIHDTYKVTFDLDSSSLAGGSTNRSALADFVQIQGDAALREVTGHFAYDNMGDNDSDELTLRGSSHEINEMLEKQINERLAMSGLEVVEARINYLAYAPEIAAVMLRRQQAAAIITAREKIVEGAVGMVEMALRDLDNKQIVNLSNDQKAAMVGNLLAVLCADEPLTPTLNATV